VAGAGRGQAERPASAAGWAWGRRLARAAGRGAVGVERGQARRPARTARQCRTDGWHAGGAGRGRAGGAGRPARVVGQGVAEAGGASVRRALRVGDGWPARDRGKAGPGRGRAGCDQPDAVRAEPRWSARGEWGVGSRGGWCVGSRLRGAEERGRMKKCMGLTNWMLMFLGWAEIHKDPPYVPQLTDLAEEHKSLCSSGI
jgi:hypothetical protein